MTWQQERKEKEEKRKWKSAKS